MTLSDSRNVRLCLPLYGNILFFNIIIVTAFLYILVRKRHFYYILLPFIF